MYQEVVLAEKTAPMGSGDMGAINASPVDIKVGWDRPEAWLVKDSANAMRIGSFLIPDPKLAFTGEADPQALDVSVVQLAGDGGGLEANIRRWMGQVGLMGNAQDLPGLIKTATRFKTRTGQEGMYVDLTEILAADITQSKSIFGAVVTGGGYTVFVKAMGERRRLVSGKPGIMAFCESISIKEPTP